MDIDDILSDINQLQIEMRAMHTHKHLMEAYALSLICMVVAAWLRSGGVKRLREPTIHPMDLLIVAYLGCVL